jgi:NADH dehydrogenase/NADH:ubiquinone oxidoreductase subunit G
MMKDASDASRQDDLKDPVSAASRCMHCDCRKSQNCRLRDYSDQYSVVQRRYDGENRKHLVRDVNENVVYEPEKCIKCGICVRITSENKDELGLTFIGRGFNVHVGPPLNAELSEALNKTAEACISNCPTGALAELRSAQYPTDEYPM